VAPCLFKGALPNIPSHAMLLACCLSSLTGLAADADRGDSIYCPCGLTFQTRGWKETGIA
jgi:hypothetical protein